MKDIIEGIEKILWFVYRVFYTLLPTIAFLFGLFLIVVHYKIVLKEDVKGFVDNYNEITWLLIMSIVVIVDMILSSISSFLIRYKPSFKRQGQDCLEKELSVDNNYIIIKKELAKIENDFSKELIQKPQDVINLIRLKIMEDYPTFHNYLWFLFSNKKMFGNLYISILILCSLALPLQILCLDEKMQVFAFISPILLLFIHFVIELIFDFPREKENLLNIILSFMLFIGLSMMITWKSVYTQIFSFYFTLIPILHYLMKKSYSEIFEFYEQVMHAYINIKFENQIFNKKENKNT